jgi:hypothetical protein
LTPSEYLDTLAYLGLTHYTVSEAFGVSWRQSFRYASGQTPVPTQLMVALGLTLCYDLFPEQAALLAQDGLAKLDSARHPHTRRVS